MEPEVFEKWMMIVLVGGLMAFMAFIIWDLAKKSKAGRLGTAILFLGLIGGGKSPTDAIILAKRYVQERPLMETVSPALMIVSASLIGPADAEEPAPGEAAVAQEPETGKSPSPLSTATVQ